jgi:hypothetical protein
MTLHAAGSRDSFFQERLRMASLPREPGVRQRPSAALAEKVLQFYGQKCVISEKEPGQDLHHVNENHNDTVFANLVPIGATFNQGIRRRQLIEDLHPL